MLILSKPGAGVATSGSAVFTGAVAFGAITPGEIVYVAFPKLDKILVPYPSFAKIPPDTNVISVDPFTVVAVLVRKLIVKTSPLEPLYPGLGTPPANSIVPSALENFGSSAHMVNTDPDLETDVTESLA